MTLLRLLSPQGIAGIAVSLCLAALLVIQKAEARHWKKQSARFELLYRGEQSAFATTVGDYRAADAARIADRANAERVASKQSAINERTVHDLEVRLADARARAEQLRIEAARATTDPGRRGSASVPGLPAPAVGSAQSPDENRLPPADALAATEQAIQLDELIRWVKAQAEVDPNANGSSR